ncbi:heparinase II/III domain-containing protein [Bacteroides sp.]
MKRNVYLIVSLFLLCDIATVWGYAERNLLQRNITKEQVKEVLLMDQKWVPYPEYTDRVGWAKFLGENAAAFIDKGEAMLDYKWKVVTATDYLAYERTGSRQKMEDPFNDNNVALSLLVAAELAEGKGRFIDQIVNGVFYFSEMTSWALSAHLNAQHSHRSLPDYREHIIELTSGQFGAMLAWIHYFFAPTFDKIDPSISSRIRYELNCRILEPYMKENRFWWMAINYGPGQMVNNWNPWCNFNVLTCFMLMENDRDKLADAVYRSMVSVDKFINYTHSDGACEEGPSYWSHAAGKMYDYLKILSLGTGGKVSVFSEPIIRNMGEYFVQANVGDNWVVNFADASAINDCDPYFVFRFGRDVKSHLMQAFAADYVRKSTPREREEMLVRPSNDIFRTLEPFRIKEQVDAFSDSYKRSEWIWYPETEVCFMNTKGGLFFAAKGGYNSESHNHNDVGSFVLFQNNMPVLIDAGVGAYTSKTFSSERYTIWTMQSNYHNLPLINGVPQQAGANFRATDVNFNPKKKELSMDIATAYLSGAQVEKWIRSYSVKNKKLTISDDFVLNETKTFNSIHFLTWGQIDLSEKGSVIIKVKGQTVELKYNPSVFDPVLESIHLNDSRLRNSWGDTIYRLSLNAKSMSAKGKYVYTIETVD